MFLLSVIYLIMHYGGEKPVVNERSKRKKADYLWCPRFNYSAERSALRRQIRKRGMSVTAKENEKPGTVIDRLGNDGGL